MKPEHVEFDVILRWLANPDAFDLTLIYNHPNDLEDVPELIDEPLSFDTSELAGLVEEEGAYGRALSEMLYRNGKVRVSFERAFDAADELPVHVRLLIDARAPARYQAIRWESLRDPNGNFRVTTRDNIRFSRRLDAADMRPVSPLAKDGQLSALVVVANPSNLADHNQLDSPPLAPVDVPDQLDRAERAMPNLSLQTLAGDDGPASRATVDQILDRLRPGVNVLYLVCHGMVVDGVPQLLLEDESGRVHKVDGADFARRIADLDRRPTIAVLCSCQSAGPGDDYLPSEDGPLAPLGPLLAAAGVAVVVAMQGNVTMTTAGRFLSRFFAELNQDGIADRAVALARGAVTDRPDWWMPVLYSRLRRGRPWYVPRFGASRARMFRDMWVRISNKECTPVLGSGIAGELFLPPRSELARDWAQRRQMPLAPATRDDLAKVAQYLSVDSGPDMPRNELATYLRSELRQRFSSEMPGIDWTGDPLQALISKVGAHSRQRLGERDPNTILASLPLPIYITTSWTRLLEDALKAAGREPDVRSFEWRRELQGVDEEEPAPTLDRPLVYHLFGTVDQQGSVVLTEDDYFAWLRAWLKRVDKGEAIPGAVKEALTDSSVMFLGYGLDDWEFRVLFQGIKSFGGTYMWHNHQHVGVQLRPEAAAVDPDAAQDYLERYFGDDKVDIYWGSCTEFANDLRTSKDLL